MTHYQLNQSIRLLWKSSIRLLYLFNANILGVILVFFTFPALAQWPGTENDSEISIASATDEQNSQFAIRLIDGTEGTADNVSWLNPLPWNSNTYPMSAILDLGGSFELTKIGYLVGNIDLGTDRVIFEFTNQTTAIGFAPLITLAGENNWGNPTVATLSSQKARFIRIKFESPQQRFNISEVRIFGQENVTPPAGQADLSITKSDGSNQYNPGDLLTYNISLTNNGPNDANGSNINDALPSELTNANWTCSASTGATCPNLSGTGSINETIALLPNGSRVNYILTAQVSSNAAGSITNTVTATLPQGIVDPITNNNSATDINTDSPMPLQDMPQTSVPGSGVVRSRGFGIWPTHLLSTACIDLHDRYWVSGADAKAYHTWHPAITSHPDTGESCDFGHEHGNGPDTSPLFVESGGWPPFGYAAEVAGGARLEDHVGHKVTVAHWEAALGNAANTHNKLHAAGFQCDWLSKIHQGSHSVDALSNHLHEYFLTVRCNDGSTRETSTAFSIKIMFTYGKPNQFKEISTNSTLFAQSIKDPNGNPIALAMQLDPTNPNINAINSREFSGAGQFIWKQMNEVTQVDLWTENVSIKTGTGSIAIGPYYIVKNPARFYNADNTYHPFRGQVGYTINLCYDDSGNKKNYTYCDSAPAIKPNWQDSASPYNGTLRAINFKSLKMYNANGPTRFCTDAYGHTAGSEPCGSNQILQTANAINNYWDAGQQAPEDDNYWVNSAGEKVFDEIAGSLVGAIPLNDNEGGFTAPGIGKEWIIDNRNPDDNNDGIPDGAHIRGEN
ncbi:MAG: DUF11 domain-containing protein [Methylococcales bacterium]|nr:DUF11 domain-containing protein [Methylococcales bacterium]